MTSVTSADGTVIDYDRYGAGPTVVFIGGATQHRRLDPNTTEMATLLATHGYTTVDYDRRGRDRSGDTPPWSLQREVEDLAALIAEVGAPAVLYTSSSGATIALAAVATGVDARALALYEPPFFAGIDNGAKVATLRELVAAGKNDDAMRFNMTDVMGIPGDAVDGMANSPSWAQIVAVAPTLPYDIGASNEINIDPDWKARWASVTVPTIVYSGELTFPGMPAAADAVAAALPTASRRTLPGQGHGPEPKAIVPVLVEFLSELA